MHEEREELTLPVGLLAFGNHPQGDGGHHAHVVENLGRRPVEILRTVRKVSSTV